jgi:hypothetical protein
MNKTPLVSPNRRASTVHPARAGICTHGTFGPKPESPEPLPSDGSSTPGFGTRIPVLDNAILAVVGHDDWKKRLKRRVRTKKMGRSHEMAERAGIRDTPFMYAQPRPQRWNTALTAPGICPTTSLASYGYGSTNYPTFRVISPPPWPWIPFTSPWRSRMHPTLLMSPRYTASTPLSLTH